MRNIENISKPDNMPFQKGHSGNPSGKVRDRDRAKNIRMGLMQFTSEKIGSLNAIFSKMTPNGKADFLLKCMKMLLPPPKETDAGIIGMLSESQLQQLKDYLLEIHEHHKQETDAASTAA
jgi:hypothetical protein